MSWRSQPTWNAWPDSALTSFVSCALPFASYQLRLYGRSSTPSTSAAWIIVTELFWIHERCSHPPLQCVINAASRLIFKRLKFDRITDSLRDEPHWLSVHYRHTYKICLLVYNCLHGTSPSYLIEQCIPIAVNPAWSRLGLLPTAISCIRWQTWHTTAIIGRRTWNQLPQNITDPSLSFLNFFYRI